MQNEQFQIKRNQQSVNAQTVNQYRRRNYTLHRFSKAVHMNQSNAHMDFVRIKRKANLIWHFGVIFSKPEKKNLKFARIQRPLNSECIKNGEFTFRKSFSALQKRTPSFSCFTCSSDVPLQIARDLME